MEPPTTGQKAIGHDESPVHTWRVSRLERLGVPGPLAEIYADCIDWHQIAQLMRRGCPQGSPSGMSADIGREDPAMTARATWRDDAACRHADPDLFFPIGATGPALRQISEAKRICRACPARTPCLAWALENGVTDGVWGATTPDERRAIRTLPRRTTTSQEDDDGEGYQPAEHAEQEIRAQAAQGKATRIFSGARAGDGPSGTGAQVTGDAARRQRFRGLVTSNVRPLGTAADVAQAIAGQLHFIRSAGVHEDRSSSYPGSGFARDFATTDGERVRVEALTRRQFADLAKTTRLARTFAFLERVLDADFSARGDLYTHRVVLGALLAPWFARHTVAELAAVFAGTSVQWAHLHIPAGSVLPHGWRA